ncbi:hypothetical protein [Myxacorys almedinensis]|uniref:Uncharacterized protein n=1 Tax=Myxacorys almedinensis A TaxID=2690445 RepID=A0A8J7Z5I0_9CYAN|nr:hypothetical protein [Myxacorys almedinensis]NDJ16798.1 hypothetical protein [Myxacorys almedinensis A]
MFADVYISTAELKPLLVQAISLKLKHPISEDDITQINSSADDDGDLTAISVTFELRDDE